MSDDEIDYNKAALEIVAPFGNYYGSPRLFKMADGSFRLTIDDYHGWSKCVQVSAEFADAWIKEFSNE